MSDDQAPYKKEEVIDFLQDGETLDYADLTEARLVKINLSKLSMKGASLAKADLRMAKLEEVDLSDANLEEASLSQIRMSRTNLAGASLKNADLNHAFMRSVIVTNADFTGADLRKVHMNGAIGCETAKFDLADLRGADLEYTGLNSLDLKKVGAKIDNTTTGLRTRVFDFFQVDDKPTHYLKNIFSFLFTKSSKIAKKVIPLKK